MRFPCFGLMLLCMGIPGLATAQSSTNELKVSGYAKAMLVSDDKKGGRPDQSTAGVGGRLGIETEDYQGFSLKAAAYTTSDLGLRHADPRKTDAYMFDLDKKPYSLLGEAQINYRLGGTTLSVGRQEFFSPVINSYEYRIIPNLFEAVTLKHRLSDSTATLAYVSKMSGLDSLGNFSEFRSMSQQAYVSMDVDANLRLDAANGDTLDLSRVSGKRGVWVTGLVDDKAQRFQLWNFYGADTLNTLYLDGRWQQALTSTLNATVEGQTYRVQDLGRFKDYLTQQGLNGRYGLVGIKGTIAHPATGISVALAMNRFSGDRNTVTSFGNWGGYPEFVSMPYVFAESSASAIAQSRMQRLTALFDLATLGMSGHSLLLGHSRIDLDENILANSDITTKSLLYRAKITSRLSMRFSFENRSSRNSRYDNSFAVFGLRYDL
jgi:hypothetical protein